jgi:hypothetical protein
MTILLSGWLFAAALFAAHQEVTFTETIAPIIYENCVTCHRPGEAAPFSLISYDDLKRRGPMIAAVTKSRYMPPWHAAHGYGEFKDERRLTDGEISLIADWVTKGMPEGDPAKLPALPSFPDGWHLGKPDLVLEMSVGFDLPASGPDIFRNFVIPTNFTEDKWVRAMEFRPSSRKAVHHVLFAYDGDGTSRKLDGADGHPGYASGMAPIGVGGGSKNAGGLGGWAVGATPFFLPEGTAVRLPKGADFVLQTHFHLTGKTETERSRVGIYFADKPPEKDLFGIELPSLFGFGAGLNIPAGKSDYTIQDSLVLPIDVRAFGVAAHAHYIASEIKATATLPDGTVQPLVWIQDWDFNWQDPYIYKEPVLLPKGTKINAQLLYNNSADNPRNPSNPPKPVMWGEQTVDEMASLNVLVVPVRREDGPALQRLLSDRQGAAIQQGVRDGTLKRMLEQRQRTQVGSK